MQTGLSQAEVIARRANGEGNDAALDGGRTYFDIIRTNLFSFFNNILYVIGGMLIALGRVNDALMSVGLAIFNAVVSTVQEMRAKRQLDKIALLNAPTCTVIRDGTRQIIAPTELVRGDIVLLQAGDQAVVDGQIVGNGRIEMDEALLTGEPDLIPKANGDTVLSGSYCVTGEAMYEATQVGADSFANQLTATAREFIANYTPLQKRIDLIVRFVMLVVAVMAGIIFLSALLDSLAIDRLVAIAAVLTGLVPYGLFTMIVVAYALGAAKIANHGALVQQTNAVESLSNVDVLCMDKTGTLTANRLQFHALKPLSEDATIAEKLGAFVRSGLETNKTSEAIAAGIAGTARAVTDEVPFASARKWSALAFDGNVYALGAVELLAPYLDGTSDELFEQAQTWSDQGLRVLLFAMHADKDKLHTSEGEIALPTLTPLALVSLSDELRPFAKETLATFEQLGIKLKIISGDNPYTVAALAKQAGLQNVKLFSGQELEAMSEKAFTEAAAEGVIFGRISPHQKQDLIDSLIQQGHYVAMIGDGVNDVLSVKKAQLGVAMQSGTQATRNVADMILLNDSFAALHPAFGEGQKIAGGLVRAAHLLLARVVSSAFIIVAIAMIGLTFPFEPAQVALTLFSVGLPISCFTVFARPIEQRNNIIRSLLRFTLPVALFTMLFGVAFYTGMTYQLIEQFSGELSAPPRAVERFEAFTGLSYAEDSAEFGQAVATIISQSFLSVFVAYSSFALILFLEPPHRFWTGWMPEVSPARWPVRVVVLLWVVFTIVVVVEPTSAYFGIVSMRPELLVTMWFAVAIWAMLLRTWWRGRWLERLLGIG